MYVNSSIEDIDKQRKGQNSSYTCISALSSNISTPVCATREEQAQYAHTPNQHMIPVLYEYFRNYPAFSGPSTAYEVTFEHWLKLNYTR